MDRLLNLLYENARLSNAQIAAMLNVPEREVADKIKELEDEGIIRGYKALVNFEKCGNEKVTALIEVKVTPQRDAGFDDIARRILQFDEVESIYLMSGGYDLPLYFRPYLQGRGHFRGKVLSADRGRQFHRHAFCASQV